MSVIKREVTIGDCRLICAEQIADFVLTWLVQHGYIDDGAECTVESIREAFADLKPDPAFDELVRRADAIRDAQRAYMTDRGNAAKGKAVAEAAAAYDLARSALNIAEVFS